MLAGISLYSGKRSDCTKNTYSDKLQSPFCKNKLVISRLNNNPALCWVIVGIRILMVEFGWIVLFEFLSFVLGVGNRPMRVVSWRVD